MSTFVTHCTWLAASLVLLGACSTPGAAKPAACDGRHRRPANPYGSVLDPTSAQPLKPAAATPNDASHADASPADAAPNPCAGPSAVALHPPV